MPGVIAEVTTLAGRLGVNVADFEIAHSLEGGAGVLVIVVAADGAGAFEDGLHDARLPHEPDGAAVTIGALSDELAFGGVRPLRGRVRVPGDKSISHRALLFAAIADGRSTLTHLATGEDVARDAHGAYSSSA